MQNCVGAFSEENNNEETVTIQGGAPKRRVVELSNKYSCQGSDHNGSQTVCGWLFGLGSVAVAKQMTDETLGS